MVVVSEAGKYYHLIVNSPKETFDTYVDSYEKTDGRIIWKNKAGELRDYPDNWVAIEVIQKKNGVSQ